MTREGPDPSAWADLVADTTPATHGELAAALAERLDVTVDRASTLVDDAIANGTLTEREGAGAFPEYHVDDGSGAADTSSDDSNHGGTDDDDEDAAESPDTDADTDGWGAATFDEPEPETYPPAWAERERWMCRIPKDKHSFAPWADRDHPEADEDADARFNWGLTENYADLETALEWDDMHPRTDGVTFQLVATEEEPFAFVDGDDVRDPETGEVHLAFVDLLDRLGLTYADISTSGSGVHACYRGDLPEGVKQAKVELDDEPWGDNDEVPVAELYDHKKVCVATGDHVSGTPLAVREWDDDALADWLDEHDRLPETDRQVDLAARREAYDGETYDPDATDANETTDDVRDIFAALDRLDVERVAERTIVDRWTDRASGTTDNSADGHRAFIPTWAGADCSGTANYVDGEKWIDSGGGGYGGPVVMALIDAGEMRPDTASPRDARGELWWAGVEHLRDLGFAIPEYDPAGATQRADHTPLLPERDDLATATSGWDWRQAAHDDGDLSIDSVRDRTTDAIADAYETGDRVLVEALPTTGKSYGAVAAAAGTDTPVTILTGRGRKEQYEQFREWCEEHGLEYKTLPAFTRDCPTANGEHGAEWADTVTDWYRRGATPQAIHKHAEYHLGRPLPCQEHEGQRCRYAGKWDFDPDEYDVLIGHYAHAHKQKVTAGRVCVFDEFPDAYETQLGHGLQGAVSYWLQTVDAVPFEDYTDLLEHRDDDQRRADALAWFLEERELDAEETHVFDDPQAHATAPLAAFTLLAADGLGNGFEVADLEDVGTGVRDRESGAVTLLRAPALSYASGVVALDGTPTKDMWELALDERLNHRQVLSDAEKREYVRDALNLNLVRTSEHVKPYNSADHVNVARDAVLLEEIADVHDQRPAVITTSTAEAAYGDAGVLELVAESKHYGNVLGSNEFKETRVGAVIGSNHYGDGFIKKWGTYAERAVERNEAKGAGLSYGTFGDRVLQHMREHDTLQAAMRFGRDGNGAVVYVHTDTLPEWVPLADEGRVVTTWSDGMTSVVDAVDDLGAASAAEIAAHRAVDVGQRQVLDHLETLCERGVLDRRQDPADGRRVVWCDDGVATVSSYGETEGLDGVSLADLDDEAVDELARSSIYTCEFVNSPGDGGSASPSGDSRGERTLTRPANEGDPPPRGAD